MTKTHLYQVLLFVFLMSALISCHHDNNSPTTPSQRSRLTYAALGASDAVGIGAFPFDQGYVYKIRDGLTDFAEVVDLSNFGVSGERIKYIEETELPSAIAADPDVVTLWAGPNDIIQGADAATFEARLGRIFARLRQETSAVVVMANVPDLTILPRFIISPDPDVTADRVNAYNRAIARQAAAYQIPLVDLYSGNYAANIDYVSIDGFHPSNKGHAKIAELYLEILRRLL
ncbi:lipolytic protein G-D-S-L family [Candidatus Moduliflexus flocculans]|uniref:Lipolytic protein G-D-S-L family n=1 Tax=Candidatus Moduliflexus flocculans TaxID=1499966 RepID=A0A081BRM4_9BACT|nr:lipolytic protein G-D-S-L family [Candidatus Moduliflexus flocculans]